MLIVRDAFKSLFKLDHSRQLASSVEGFLNGSSVVGGDHEHGYRMGVVTIGGKIANDD